MMKALKELPGFVHKVIDWILFCVLLCFCQDPLKVFWNERQFCTFLSQRIGLPLVAFFYHAIRRKKDLRTSAKTAKQRAKTALLFCFALILRLSPADRLQLA
jgi:hypothetical protein